MRNIISILFLVLSASFVFTQHTEELYSPNLLSTGLNTTSLESPVGDILNPAASGLKQRTTLDLSYISLPYFGSESSGGMGHAGNLGLSIPGKIGVFSFSGHFIHSPFSWTNIGTMLGLYGSFAKDLFPNFLIGAGIGVQAGWQGEPFGFGIGLDLGILHILGELGILKDFRWGISFRGLGLGYTPTTDTRLLPRAFTPSVGANFKIIDINNFSVAFSPDISLPEIIPVYSQNSNLRASLGCEIVLLDFLYLNGNIFYDVLEASDTTNRPFFSFGGAVKFKLPATGKIKFLDISERGWDRSEIKLNMVGVPLQNNIWGIGAGLNIPLGSVDNVPPKIIINTDEEIYISPNLDGVQDDLVLPISITDTRYVKGYRFIIEDGDGVKIREIANKEARPENVSFKNVMDRLFYVKKGILIPESIRWDGKSDSGTAVKDGKYSYYLEGWDDNGNTNKSSIGTVYIDNTAPIAEVKTQYLIFSPNSDGNKDTLQLEQKGSSEDKWKGTITDQNSDTVAVFNWESNIPESFEWDGKNSEGILASDGVYHYKLTSTDRAGNMYEEKIDNIIINTQATPINITVNMSEFSPNNDGEKDYLRFNLDIPVTSGIENWMLTISNIDGQVVRTYSGSDKIPDFIDFDGTNDVGVTLTEITYTAFLQLKYINGNNPHAASPEFVIDITPPKASINSNEQIFSPNNDGNKDTIIFSNETSNEDVWIGEIKDEKMNVVKKIVFRGRADLSVVWEGRGDNNRLVPDGIYSYRIYATDRAGNYGSSPAITFEVNTAETPVFLSTDQRIFSPNSDGIKDTIAIIPHLKVTKDLDRYTLTIMDEKKRIVKTIKGNREVPSEFKWNGKDDSGKSLADGKYVAGINILYTNGNNPVAETSPFIMDTIFPTIDIDTEYTLFSPDNDGNKDYLLVKQNSSKEELWEGEIKNNKDEVVLDVYWKGEALSFKWDGKDKNGNKIDDGDYTYRIYCIDNAGNKTERMIKDIRIDTRITNVFLTVDSSGFSPNDDGYRDSIDMRIHTTLKEGLKSWNLDINHQKLGVQKIFSGSKEIVETLTWDGKAEGKLVPEGIYSATVKLYYHKGNQPQADSLPFRLDISPPYASLSISPSPFSPDNDGIDDELYIKTDVKDLSKVSLWNMKILDPKGRHFINFNGKGIPSSTIIWDGMSDSGEIVQSAEDYLLQFNVQDELGNRRTVETIVPIDILVVKMGDKYKIRIPSITFKPDTADYLNVQNEKKERNLKTLNRLSEIFKKYNKYHILIEGHAVSLYWADPVKAEVEQEKDLIPLSKNRAESIKQGLIELGIEEWRIETTGLGGSQPIVPHGDLENRWKNRRVEFILVKKLE